MSFYILKKHTLKIVRTKIIYLLILYKMVFILRGGHFIER
jgi:hypothetical protein